MQSQSLCFGLEATALARSKVDLSKKCGPHKSRAHMSAGNVCMLMLHMLLSQCSAEGSAIH